MTSPLLLQKVVLPQTGEPDVIPLYIDVDSWTELREEVTPDPEAVKHRRGVVPKDIRMTSLRLSEVNAIGLLNGRRGLVVPPSERVSFGAYYNAFPAGYWRRWTSVPSVTLRVTTRGSGELVVYRSNARGVIQTAAAAHVEGETTTEIPLAFDNFLDGGWYWFDLVSTREEFELVEAGWFAPEGYAPPRDRGVTVSITTLNRGDYCTALLKTIGEDQDTMSVIDRVVVVDQGSQRIVDNPGFAAASAALGSKLDVIEQVNAGGSGGFSRGMLETVSADTSDFVLLLDDDVTIDPESIRRAHTFGRACIEPTIVGGHMFDMYDKTHLHAFAEAVDRWPFMWGPITPGRHDLASSNLRQTTWMHQRIDVDYNGWWMSLIPVDVIKKVGLSLPVFIKWDDAEYSLRASEHGFSTVSLPGAAVWHVSWVDKDDSTDWQAFFHARNRLIAALLHSPHDKGGRLPISNLASDVRHLFTTDYYAVALRQLAYESVLSGPASLHGELLTRLPAIRQIASEYTESALHKDLSAFEHFPRTDYLGEDPGHPDKAPRGPRLRRLAMRLAWSHWWRPTSAAARATPQVHLAAHTPWWIASEKDSYLRSNAEGSGATWHLRDRAKFRSLLVSSLRSNLRLRREWGKLREDYRRQLPEITSPEAWSKTLGLGSRR